MNQTLHFTEITSPLGTITLTATERGLSGLYFAGQKHWPADSSSWLRDDGTRCDAARAWLSSYFSGEGRAVMPELDPASGTPFQTRVWQALKAIPKGQTATYGQIAGLIASPSASRAVGAAIGRNPISILIPCHRIIGSTGMLTGYAGGEDRKRWLLEHEGAL